MNTAKISQGVSDTSNYINGLLIDGSDLQYGIDVLLDEFDLHPMQHQALTECSQQLERIIDTLESARLSEAAEALASTNV